LPIRSSKEQPGLAKLFPIIAAFLILNSGLFCIVHAEESASSVEKGKPYYGDLKRGWWWYEKTPEKKQDNEKKTADKAVRAPVLADYSMETLWNMYPDDFQALLMAFQKKAVRVPSEDNVREYYVVQDIARRKSLAFANATAMVMQKYPDLAVAADYPITAPGRNAVIALETGEIEAKIRSARYDFALILFSAAGCPYCVEQKAILDHFVGKYAWEIREIDTERQSGTAAVFGIETTPTLLLVYRENKDHIAVSAGVASLSEIEEKLYRGIRLLKKEITPEEYSLYEFQRGGAFDVNAPLRRDKK
jgi:conjugal transfer pilus assembly protein TraF